jgi:hypothetical protein
MYRCKAFIRNDEARSVRSAPGFCYSGCSVSRARPLSVPAHREPSGASASAETGNQRGRNAAAARAPRRNWLACHCCPKSKPPRSQSTWTTRGGNGAQPMAVKTRRNPQAARTCIEGRPESARFSSCIIVPDILPLVFEPASWTARRSLPRSTAH